MKNLRSAILTLFLGLPLSALPLYGQTYHWSGDGDNGNWSNPDNWDTLPDFNAANNTQNGYIFVFDTLKQPLQNTTNTARFGEMRFDAGDFTLQASSQFLFGAPTGGITVDSGNIVLQSDRVSMTPFRDNSTGGLKVNNGTLQFDITTTFSIGGSNELRYLPVEGNGTITINATLVHPAGGGGIKLTSGFSGRLILNTAGSTIGGGTLSHAGTGILELRANDAAGVLPFEFLNSQAAIEAGGAARTLQNNVTAHDGFRVTGSHALGLAGTLDLGTGSQTVEVVETGGALLLQNAVTGSGGTFTKTGEGTLAVEADNTATWSQTVAISEGELHVANATGLATGSGTLAIGADARLSGSGRVGETEIAGTLLLEGAEGITFADDLSLQTGSQVTIAHGAEAALVEGNLDFSEGVTLSLDASTGWAVGETYRLFELAGGSITGELALAGPYAATFSYQSGADGYVDFQITAIPEPSTLLLGTLAFTLAAVTLRRRKTASFD